MSIFWFKEYLSKKWNINKLKDLGNMTLLDTMKLINNSCRKWH